MSVLLPQDAKTKNTRKATFEIGGVHPPEKKYLSKDRSIKALQLPQNVTIPLIQHIGRAAVPVVAVGDKVNTGQLIAEPGGFISAAIHASISGTVTKIDSAMHPFGKNVPCISIESDSKDEKDTSLKPLILDDSTPEMLIERVKQAGIVGLGGATFPTHVKLMPPKDKKVDVILLNGAECEPFLTCDYRSMIEAPKDIITGLQILIKIIGAEKGVIAIEDNKPDAYEKLRAQAKDSAVIDVVMTQVKYPQGAEKQLISAVLNRVVPSGGLPFDVGVIVQNVGTAIAIKNAVLDGVSLYERVVTITGDAINTTANYRIRIGTSISDVIAHCRGFKTDPYKVIMGGPMMGIALSSIDVPVLKGTSGILVLSKEQATPTDYSTCIRCSRCIKACPMNLMPSMIGSAVEVDNYDIAEEHYINDCIECGCCSYVCPAKRPLVQFMKFGKFALSQRERGR